MSTHTNSPSHSSCGVFSPAYVSLGEERPHTYVRRLTDPLYPYKKTKETKWINKHLQNIFVSS